MEYKLIPLTTDAIVIKKGKVLLVKRQKDPFKGLWALPGGFVNYGEKTEDACIRELFEETSCKGIIEKLIGVYSNPKRDPRGHVISVAYLVKTSDTHIHAHDDAADSRWFFLESLPNLAFDHKDILHDALQTIK